MLVDQMYTNLFTIINGKNKQRSQYTFKFTNIAV